MNYSFDNNKIVSSKFVQEDYFPVIIEFSNEELNNTFIEFNYKDSDMFEICVNPDTYALKRFTLTLCNHYTIKDANINIPRYEEGTLHITGPSSTECDLFEVIVYENGVEIKTSSRAATRNIKSGQLIFTLNEKDELSSVLITNLTQENINHIVAELTF